MCQVQFEVADRRRRSESAHMLRLDERKWSSTNEGLLQLLAKVMAVGLAPKEKLIR
jgi:hypothetical protein